MQKTAAAPLPVLADLRPTDDSAPAVRAAIARAMARLVATRDRKAELAASLPALILATDDDASIDLVEADIRAADRDVTRIEALLGELRERLTPAEQLERIDQLTVIARRANAAVDAAKEWRDQSFPDVVRILADGARLRLSARILCAEYDRSLQAARLPPDAAVELPQVVTPDGAFAPYGVTLTPAQALLELVGTIVPKVEAFLSR